MAPRCTVSTSRSSSGPGSEERLVEESLAKLKLVPEVLAACRPTWTRAWRRGCWWTARWARPAPAARSSPRRCRRWCRTRRLRARLAEAAEPAAAAFDELAAFLTDFAERCEGDWRLGEQTYSRLLQDVEMLGYDTAELHRRGQAA